MSVIKAGNGTVLLLLKRAHLAIQLGFTPTIFMIDPLPYQGNIFLKTASLFFFSTLYIEPKIGSASHCPISYIGGLNLLKYK